MDQRLASTHASLREEGKDSLVSRKRKSGEGTKEERQETKRLKKLKQAEKSSSNGITEEGTDTEAAAKAARKAEKARLKELKTTGGDESTLIQSGTHTKNLAEPVADTVAPVAEAEQKHDKSRLKDGTKSSQRERGKTENGDRRTSTSAPTYVENPTLSTLPQPEIDSFLSSNFITISDPSSSQPLRPIISFSHLPDTVLPKPSPFAAFKNPTPIQSAAWPFLLSGRDVIGVAETGSGKTLAFGLPCIRHISTLSPASNRGSTARAVIVSPTRELAVQIFDQIVQLASPAGLKAVCVYGGVPKDAQRLALKTAHIVVATPGRLNDLINEGAADLSNVDYVVLDEADRMLDKGFEDEIRKIISTTRSPASSRSKTAGRQTLMFTATWPPSVRDLASTFMLSPVKIAIGDNPSGELRANTSITQRVEVVDPYAKEQRLLQLLKQNSPPKTHTRILVFCLYKKEATRIENFLRMKGLQVAGIHGDLSQEKRSASLEAFKRDGGVPILVATDVAARGLDIPAVKVVINVTFPLTVEDYVHRIGR